MKRRKVLTLSQYRKAIRRDDEVKDGAGASNALPDADNLWKLLDSNISIDIWKKGI